MYYFIFSEFQNLLNSDKDDDLGRMYQLVSRIPDGVGELKRLLENHINNQGLVAIDKLGDEAINVSILIFYQGKFHFVIAFYIQCKLHHLYRFSLL